MTKKNRWVNIVILYKYIREYLKKLDISSGMYMIYNAEIVLGFRSLYWISTEAYMSVDL